MKSKFIKIYAEITKKSIFFIIKSALFLLLNVHTVRLRLNLLSIEFGVLFIRNQRN